MSSIVKKLYFSLILLSFYTAFVAAETDSPSGAELKQACEKALVDGFDSIEGLACRWYVTPCDCHHSDENIKRVCLPPDINESELAKKVIAGLQAKPELLSAKAIVAANNILAESYPCTE